MYSHDIAYALKRASKKPIVVISGPRQTGKTLLAKSAFKNHKYVSFADPDTRLFAAEDPERFLAFYKNEYGVILDDISLALSFLPYIQEQVHNQKRAGSFVLISSQKLPLEVLKPFKDTLSTLTLFPTSRKEYGENQSSLDEELLIGSLKKEHYAAYIQNFLEHEVKPSLREKNYDVFAKFLQRCAGYVGKAPNLDVLAQECCISFNTARQWLSLLETHYFIFLLPPYRQTFNKRVVKSPQLYFLDPGICTYLLRITSAEILALHPLRSALFENFIIGDLYKQFCNHGMHPPLFYWKDQNGRYKIDCLIQTDTLYAIDIQPGQTLSSDGFKKLRTWGSFSDVPSHKNFIIYAGTDHKTQEHGTIIGWQAATELVETLI